VNSATLHTSRGCSIPSTDSSSLGITGAIQGTTCESNGTVNAGCGIQSTDQKSYGAPFNGNGGGSYAMRWDDSGIAVWFFQNGQVPWDLTSGLPQPENWGPPMAAFPFSSCDSSHFGPQTMIFDTTLW
jgi:hypothetical protein